MHNTPSVEADPFSARLPAHAKRFARGLYDPFPAFEPSHGTIHAGHGLLAERIDDNMRSGLRVLVVDGYHGIDWPLFREGLTRELSTEATWFDLEACVASPGEIRRRIEPFLGADDPIFGTHYPLGPDVFFDAQKLAEIRIQASGAPEGSLTIIYGSGAALIDVRDELWYADIPKDVVQDRARQGRVFNIGCREAIPFNEFYKRAYFVEWPALNRHKRSLLPGVDLFLDLQDERWPRAMTGAEFRAALHELAEVPFRPRPWFFPGPWGGKFMQGHMGVLQEEPNVAWSFELITPENGIVLEKGGETLELSFDCLMYQEHVRVLGPDAARRFGYEWPIRLDYLDTVDGGNLSVQCHPSPEYIRQHFGETFTQDETYYIAAAKPDARVYLGLQEDCDQEEFRQAVTRSATHGIEVDVDRFVQSMPSRPHDLFLIPNGTVHCSGEGNLVLEISATPYIFTFKIYDYLRRDLQGNLRPINIDRAWNNIRPERRGEWVRQNLVASPRLLKSGNGWSDYLLSDREELFYNIHRIEFEERFSYETDGRAFAVNLVEGERVDVITSGGRTTRLNYLESMLIPAATGAFEVVNAGDEPCKLVLVYVRP